MRPSLPRRTAAVVATLATPLALAGLAVATAPTASADVLDPAPTTMAAGLLTFSTSPDSSANPPDSCSDVSGSGAGAPIALVPDGQPKPYQVSGSATTKLNNNDADTATGTAAANGTVTASQAGGQLSRLAVSTSWSGSVVNAGQGARCNLSATAGAQVTFGFTLVRSTYVTVSTTAKRGQAIGAVLPGTGLGFGGPFGSSLPGSSFSVTSGDNGTGVGRLLLAPGHYAVIVAAAGGPAAAGTSSGTASVEITFDTPGVAKTAAVGSASKYVALPDATDCVAHTATATWGKKAGKKKNPKVKKATFKVESAKVGSDKKPLKGDKTVLKSLPTNEPFTITAEVKLASGKTVEVERDYQACGV